MISVDPKSWLWTSLIVVLAGGFLAVSIQWGSLPDSLTGAVFVLVLAPSSNDVATKGRD